MGARSHRTLRTCEALDSVRKHDGPHLSRATATNQGRRDCPDVRNLGDLAMTPPSELKRLAEGATPWNASHLIRYKHGGGRLALTEPRRELIADFYNENDREYIAAAMFVAYEM